MSSGGASPPLLHGHLKILAIIAISATCLSTIFTSPSLGLDNGTAHQLAPQVPRYCKGFLSDDAEYELCSGVVTTAYSIANLQCTTEIINEYSCTQLCNDEGMTSAEIKGCRTGCKEKVAAVRICVDGVVREALGRNNVGDNVVVL
jgi:hypothetical protein